jgi:hypothetical protein
MAGGSSLGAPVVRGEEIMKSGSTRFLRGRNQPAMSDAFGRKVFPKVQQDKSEGPNRFTTRIGVMSLNLSVVLTLYAALAMVPLAALSQERGAREQGGNEVDDENIFGFTEGSDIGKAGETIAQLDGRGGFGLPGGSYSAWTNFYQLKFSITDNFRVMPYLTSAYHYISGFEEIEGLNSMVFQGGGIEFRYRALDRERAPFGLTFFFDPHGNRADPFDGQRVRQLGVAFGAIVDKEIVKDRIFAAFNAVYEPEWTRIRATSESVNESQLSISGALSAQFAPRFFLGAEIRHIRRYDGAGLNSFLEDVWYAGPTVAAKMSENWNMTLAWNIKFAGTKAEEELSRFSNNQVRARLAYVFPVPDGR